MSQVTHVIQKQDTIIKEVNTREPHQKSRMKIGVMIPNNLQHTKELDFTNGNTLWYEVIKKEMENMDNFQDLTT